MNRWIALAVLLAITGALALRLPKLDLRPLHNDEAVNAVKVSELWQHGRYRYDPDEYHGPSLHYATLPFLWLSAARNSDQLDDATLRLAPVAFGVGLIFLLLLFVDGLSRQAVLWAAIFTAVSPVMVFYSRYFIHEMLLVFFTTLTLGAGWRYAQTRQARWAVVAGLGIGLMFATKETFVLALAAMAVALVVVQASSLRQCLQAFRLQAGTAGGTPADTAASKDACATTPWLRHATFAALAALLVWFVLFSSVFTNFAGLADSIRTYLPWLKRAGGQSPHIHPWNFYLERLAWFHPARGPVWSEGAILVLAALGVGVALFGKRSPLPRFLAIYTIALTAAYAVISYKTPWCLLGFWHGMILLAGIGAAGLVEFARVRKLKFLVIAVLVVQTALLAGQAWRANFVFASDRRNPYVYAQTVPDLLNLVKKVEGLAQVAPAGYDTVVKVIAPGSDYWPLPWYLRRFHHIGWFDKLPADPFAPVVIVAAKLDTGSPMFSQGDFLDLPALAKKLKQPTNQIDTWLAGQLSPTTKRALSNYQGQGAESVALRASLVQELNHLITGPSIYQAQRFAGVELRTQAQGLLSENPQGDELLKLNRSLLEDAYTMELARSLDARLDERSGKKWVMVGLFELRPGNFLELYVELELWKKHVATLPREEELSP